MRLLRRLRFPLGNARGTDASNNVVGFFLTGYEIESTVLADRSCLLLIVRCAWQGKDPMVGLAQSGHSRMGGKC